MEAGKAIRPFSLSAKIHCKAYSTPLQRVIVDFGSEVSFTETARLLKDHYGLNNVSVSSIRSITERHAHIIHHTMPQIQKKRSANLASQIIMESDGGMVPIVTMQEDAKDQRRTRTVGWAENKLSLAYAKGTINPTYASTMEGVDVAGNQLADIADLIGRDDTSDIHFVADGATWIADQVEAQFGTQANFLIDFFHLSEYLHKASLCCDPEHSPAWTNMQKQRMKEGKIMTVIHELEQHINQDKKNSDHQCAAETCYNYMIKRLKQFNYKDAIANDLPIGSGKIEGGHRSVIQKRLKLSGAWWRKVNAGSMASLRVLKANGYYNDYWSRRKMSETRCN